MLQWLKASRTCIVVFEQEALKIGLGKYTRNGFIIAAGIELALIVPSTNMYSKSDFGMITNNCVVHFDTGIDDFVGVVPTLDISFAHLWIKESCILRRINLYIRTTQTNQFFYFPAREIYNIGQIR